MQEPKKILAAMNDLFFGVKINESAKRAGMQVEFAKNDTEVLAKAKGSQPALIIIDLNCADVQALQLIPKLKSDAETRQIALIAFVSHVQGELKQQAQDAGCDVVLARSAFSQNLPQILKHHAELL